MVGNQVLGVAEVGESAEDVASLVLRQVPLFVVDHVDNGAELGQASRDELRQFGFARLVEEITRRLLDMLRGGIVFHGRARLVDDRLEPRQVVVAQCECDVERHAGVPRVCAYPKLAAPNIKLCESGGGPRRDRCREIPMPPIKLFKTVTYKICRAG